MKLKQTDSGNIKLTLTPFEMNTVLQVLSHVQLGNGAKSDVVFDLFTKYENEFGFIEDFGDISVTTEIQDGAVSYMISV